MGNIIAIRVVSDYTAWKTKKWPTKLSCRPLVGDFIEELNEGTVAKIVSIKHTVGKEYNRVINGWKLVPILIVEVSTITGNVPD